jgi:hypothetical protein
VRPELEPLPERMSDLPVDERGFPVPWFVAWFDGKPEFRAMDGLKWIRAVREHLCWVCGGRLGVWQTFVLGPMCGINRTTVEPPCHLECARWSARNCPFLARPHMVRREDGLPEDREVGGISIPRNPGVALLWTARSFEIFEDDAGKPLIHVHNPEAVEWWAEGRPATRAEVAHSVDTGIPLLIDACQMGGEEAMADLARRKAWLETHYPAAEVPAGVTQG